MIIVSFLLAAAVAANKSIQPIFLYISFELELWAFTFLYAWATPKV